jgi:hypothetical protein
VGHQTALIVSPFFYHDAVIGAADEVEADLAADDDDDDDDELNQALVI